MRCIAFILVVLVIAASCEMLKVGEVPPETVIKRQLNELQIAVENSIPENSKAKIAVLGIVDTATMKKPAEGEEADQTALDAAAKREREVRQGLNEVLVANTLIEVLQPSQEQQDQARAAIGTANSCTLDAKVALAAGTATMAEFVVNALIDDNGKQVNLAVQRASDGVVVFQDTLSDWAIAVTEEEAPAA